MTHVESIGVVAEQDYLLHRIPQPVRESPSRLLSVYQRLHDSDIAAITRRYPARSADESLILRIHSEMYLQQLRQNCLSPNPFAYDRDTYLMEDSLYVSALAVGGCLTLADAIMAREVSYGFAVVRPPGHHAGVGNGQGFCIFNNVAVTAQYLRDKYGLNRLLIVDYDAHHGNGTEEIFYDDPGVLVISIHQRALFPSTTGMETSVGTGKGVGYNINIPVHGTFGDVEYNYIFGKVVHNIIRQYAPEFILVSAGFDGHVDDSMSELALTTAWYAHVAECLKGYAVVYGINRLLFVLEGGYHPKTLESAVTATLHGLSMPTDKALGAPFSRRAAELLADSIVPHYGSHWDFS